MNKRERKRKVINNSYYEKIIFIVNEFKSTDYFYKKEIYYIPYVYEEYTGKDKVLLVFSLN